MAAYGIDFTRWIPGAWRAEPGVMPGIPGAFGEYAIDALQRTILLLDVLRQRGDTFVERKQDKTACVLQFESEVILDGADLPRPVNYRLLHVLPGAQTPAAPGKRPFVVVDPRAGHGPGIGGMKADSQIGVILAGGHPCYFIGFDVDPLPGQTIEDVARAQMRFVEEVAARHPDAEGKPCVIGNCQAGWQIMVGAALEPDVPGPIMLAGTPMSYWAGVRGRAPMRYTGGLAGGTWMTALAGDLGKGLFDGSNLVANFENLNPANTWWTKPYNVYANVDTEVNRFLDFETWWAQPILLNAGEMQWIADELFVGNRLTSGDIRASDGTRIDLHNIHSSIVVFCSWGDDITPPQQALGFLTDMFADDDDLIASGQTFVYSLHPDIGHLGIFVSGRVANKEHDKFIHGMNAVDLMPPGLFEAVISECDDAESCDLVHGRYVLRFEGRSLDDIRALGNNSPEDEQRFETVARISEVNKAFYHTFLSPVVQAMTTPTMAETLRLLHPFRQRFKVFSSSNPWMTPVRNWAETVREHRRPVSQDNIFLAFEKAFANTMESNLQTYGRLRDIAYESLFLSTYGSPLIQAAVGLEHGQRPSRGATRDLTREMAAKRDWADIEQHMEHGTTLDAVLRALLFIYRSARVIDERVFAIFLNAPDLDWGGARPSLIELSKLVRNQFLLVHKDEKRALETLHLLLPDAAARRKVEDVIARVMATQKDAPEEAAQRLARVKAALVGPELPRPMEAAQ